MTATDRQGLQHADRQGLQHADRQGLQHTDRQDWAQYAACASDDPPNMYPHEQDAAGVSYAKAFCARCPVQQQCLEYAFGTRERFGVWGGLTETERSQVSRREARERRKASA